MIRSMPRSYGQAGDLPGARARSDPARLLRHPLACRPRQLQKRTSAWDRAGPFPRFQSEGMQCAGPHLKLNPPLAHTVKRASLDRYTPQCRSTSSVRPPPYSAAFSNGMHRSPERPQRAAAAEAKEAPAALFGGGAGGRASNAIPPPFSAGGGRAEMPRESSGGSHTAAACGGSDVHAAAASANEGTAPKGKENSARDGRAKAWSTTFQGYVCAMLQMHIAEGMHLKGPRSKAAQQQWRKINAHMIQW